MSTHVKTPSTLWNSRNARVVVLVVIAGWFGGITRPLESANAQVPDSGQQRNQMLEELRQSNRKLAEIADLLREMNKDRAAAEKRPTRPSPSKP